MDGLYTANNVLIVDHIRDEIPNKEGFKVVNRFLDGTWFMQTIGQPASVMNLNCYAELDKVNLLNLMQATGTSLKIITRGETKVGYIDGDISWAESAPGYYQGQMRILITEE